MAAFVFIALIVAFEEPQIDKEKLAQCLTEKDAKLYGSGTCQHSTAQKNAFGDALQYINYTNCDNHAEECRDAGIDEYPIWIINGEKHYGQQSFKKLAALTGCKLL